MLDNRLLLFTANQVYGCSILFHQLGRTWENRSGGHRLASELMEAGAIATRKPGLAPNRCANISKTYSCSAGPEFSTREGSPRFRW